MKYLLSAALLLTLASCQKKQTWVCSYNAYNDSLRTVERREVVVPDMTKKEKNKYENDNNSRSLVDINGNPFNVDMSCR